MAVLVGTSGWQYADWKNRFYPAQLPQRDWLEYYASRFATVEVNNAFYRLPDRSTFETWRKRTPPDFVVAIKASRFLTHIKRLQAPAEPVGRLVGRLHGLGDKCGPILLQLPPTLRIDLEALSSTLSCFPNEMRIAVEFRHPSWFVEETRALLEHFRSALCLTDAAGMQTPHWRTTNWGYVRFHGGRAHPLPCYGRRALQSWTSRLDELFGAELDVYAYFNNDTGGCAPRNAASFLCMLADQRLADPSSVRAMPSPSSRSKRAGDQPSLRRASARAHELNRSGV